MAILLCNKCSYLREVSNDYVGKSVKCPVCKEPVPIHNSVAFVKNIISKYQGLNDKYRQLKEKISGAEPLESVESLDEGVDLHNTSAMTEQTQFKPIIDWFDKKGIILDIDASTIDTQGFF